MDRRQIGIGAVVIALVAASAFLGYRQFQAPSGNRTVKPIDVNESERRIRKGEPDYHRVVIQDGKFDPSSLTIQSGEGINKVVWVNRDRSTHYLTLVRNETVFSRTLPAGGNFSWTPYEPGKYRFSAPEINDTGTITVR